MKRQRWKPALRAAAACWILTSLADGLAAPAPTAVDLGPDDQMADLWETAQGLPQGTVTAITQTRDGYLWLGTPSGLACFDGVRFQTFNRLNTPALHSNRITALLADTDGGLWIGTADGGAVRLLQGKFRSFTTAEGLADNEVRSLGGGQAGVWIGTAKGVNIWLDGELRHPVPAGSVGSVGSICEIGEGALWLLGRDGLYEAEARRVSRVKLAMEPGLAEYGWQGLAWGQNGNLWLFGDSLARVSAAGRSASAQAVELAAGDRITAVCERADGDLDNFDTRDGLWDNTICQILEDNLDPVLENQQLWMGSNRGVFRVAKTSFDDYRAGKIAVLEPVVYGSSEGMDCLECSGGFGPAGLIQTPSENPATLTAVLWFATLRGLARFELFPLMGRARGISGDHLAFTQAVLHLGPDHTRFDLGDVVAGGNGFGTGRAAGIHPGDGSLQADAASFVYRDGATVAAERYHRTQLPLVDGVFVPDGGVVPGRKTLVSSTGLMAEFPPTTGEAWGLIKSGLRVFRQDVFNPTEMGALGVPMVWTSGNMGITFDLAAVRQATGKTITRFSSQVCNLHIGPASFHVLLDGRVVAKRSGLVHDYGRYQRGIVPVDIPVPPQARFLTLVATDDKDEPGAFNRQPPVVSIEEVLADGVPQQAAAAPGTAVVSSALHPAVGGLEIAPGAGRLDFRCAAPNLTAPEKVRFRYRLEPLEADWVEAGDQRTATYARLAPGTYRFLVTACNNDAVWSPAGAAVTVTLRPHFWQAHWFAPLWIGALVLLIAGITAALLRIRHRRQVRQLEQTRAIAMERTRIARDIHDDLGAGLTHVALLTDLVRNELADPETAKGHLDEVFTVARRLARGVDEIVWAINPKNDALELSLNYITKSAQDFLRAAGIACRLDWPESLPPGTLTSAQRHHLYLVVREALNNVVKHAAATAVGIRWAAMATGIAVEISDNGRGFTPPPADAPTTRHGLGSMAGRMADAGGRLEITSSLGEGTHLRLWLPLQRAGIGS